jgi:hypothetical protein
MSPRLGVESAGRSGGGRGATEPGPEARRRPGLSVAFGIVGGTPTRVWPGTQRGFLSTYCDPELARRFKAAAEHDGRTISGALRFVAEAYAAAAEREDPDGGPGPREAQPTKAAEHVGSG